MSQQKYIYLVDMDSVIKRLTIWIVLLSSVCLLATCNSSSVSRSYVDKQRILLVDSFQVTRQLYQIKSSEFVKKIDWFSRVSRPRKRGDVERFTVLDFYEKKGKVNFSLESSSAYAFRFTSSEKNIEFQPDSGFGVAVHDDYLIKLDGNENLYSYPHLNDSLFVEKTNRDTSFWVYGYVSDKGVWDLSIESEYLSIFEHDGEGFRKTFSGNVLHPPTQ